MTTGKKAASDASRILRNPKSTPKQKEVAASDLAQRRGAKPKRSRTEVEPLAPLMDAKPNASWEVWPTAQPLDRDTEMAGN